MKKALIYAAVVCGVSWVAALVFHLTTGYTGPEAGMAAMMKYQTFASLYMFLPAIVALLMQLLSGEMTLRRKHATRVQLVPQDRTLLKFRPRWSWLAAIGVTVGMVALSLFFSTLFADYMPMKEGTLALMAAQGLENIPADQLAQLEALPEWVMVLSTALSGIVAGVTINAVFAFGEEYGWRYYMVSKLRGSKFLSAALLIGFVWGIWHAPMILMGHNYPDARIAGVAMMVLFCVLGGVVELYFVLKSGSVWVAAFIHGTINALAGMAVLMYPGSSPLLTGMTGVAGVLAMGTTIALIYLYDRKHERIFHSTLGSSLSKE